MNTAAVKAALDGSLSISLAQLEFAKDKILMGAERKSLAISEECRKVRRTDISQLVTVNLAFDWDASTVKASIWVPRPLGTWFYLSILLIVLIGQLYYPVVSSVFFSAPQNTAYHESGHAIVALHTPGALPIHKATIMPRGAALGMVTQLPGEDYENSRSRQQMQVGGRIPSSSKDKKRTSP